MDIKITFYVEKETAIKVGEKGIRTVLNRDVMTLLVSDVLGRMNVRYTKLNIDYGSFDVDSSIICNVIITDRYIDRGHLTNLIGVLLYEYKGFGDISKYTVEPININKYTGDDDMKRSSVKKSETLYISEDKIINASGHNMKINRHLLKNNDDIVTVIRDDNKKITNVNIDYSSNQDTKVIVSSEVFEFLRSRKVGNVLTSKYPIAYNGTNPGMLDPEFLLSHDDGTCSLHVVESSPYSINTNNTIQNTKTLVDKKYEVETSLSFGWYSIPSNSEVVFKDFLTVSCELFKEYVENRRFKSEYTKATTYDTSMKVCQILTIFESDIKNFDIISTITNTMKQLESKYKCQITTNVIITEVS